MPAAKLKIHDVEQGTEPWFKARAGVITGSEAHNLFTATQGLPKNGGVNDSVLNYAARLAADVHVGRAISSEEHFFSTKATRRGTELEPEACSAYEAYHAKGAKVVEVGFGTRGSVGASPDRLVGDDGMLEMKCFYPEQHVRCCAMVNAGVVPPKQYAQAQVELYVFERKWNDLAFYHPEITDVCAVIRVKPDFEFRRNLEKQVRVVLKHRKLFEEALKAVA